MIQAFVNTEKGIRNINSLEVSRLPKDAVWLDLLDPDPEEEAAVESFLRIDVPSEEEIVEIEDSSRFYQRKDNVYVTATVLSRLETGRISDTDVRFALTPKTLVSIRYEDSRPFRLFSGRLLRDSSESESSDSIMEKMLEMIVDDMADILERIALDVDELSHKIFFSRRTGNMESDAASEISLHDVIKYLGRYGEQVSEIRLSILNMNRLLIFLSQCGEKWWRTETRSRLQTLIRDVRSLTEHAAFLANRVSFMLDGVLGMINIEQNNIIKIFSVAAVVFLPPTLIASIYGMNFRSMPELSWDFGYPVAILLMIISALLPYSFFKRKGWL
ncbi:MAG: magnesium/cobalt transporter CorA [Desulfomonilaceae bacterium]|nr:magnesium/cobalt transporter CorA [Desulfomonilaceae bacterium]